MVSENLYIYLYISHRKYPTLLINHACNKQQHLTYVKNIALERNDRSIVTYIQRNLTIITICIIHSDLFITKSIGISEKEKEKKEPTKRGRTNTQRFSNSKRVDPARSIKFTPLDLT